MILCDLFFPLLYDLGDPKVGITENEAAPNNELGAIEGIAKDLAMVERTDSNLFNQIYPILVNKQKML